VKSLRALWMMACWSILFLTASAPQAQPPEPQDKTLSPYFLVKGGDQDLDVFALKATSAEVAIAGVIADVKVTQVYQNKGKKPLETIYIFPASTRAAVYGMKMTIGSRTIVAKIERKEKARQDYEQAKSQGKSASLLEQQRPNVFQMNVANILPGDEIKVELSYTELLVPTDGVYSFIYPTVVGPRYSNKPEAGAPESDKWTQNPYLHEGEAPPYTFDLKADLAAGLPIQEITCATHKTDIKYDGKNRATVRLDPADKAGGNRDFILKYRLEGGQVESGLLLYQGEQENFFLLLMQPPKRVSLSQIPPREYIFIMDVSGSMNGFPIETSKKLLSDLIGNLRSTDLFNVVLFAGGSAVMSEKSLPATADNVKQALDVIDQQQGGGGTELLPALKRALALPKTEGFSRTVVIATDGYVDVEKEAFDLIRQNLDQANMFAFGIGSSVNRFLIEGLARVGQGEPFVVVGPEQAPAQAAKFRELIQSPVLTGIKVDYGQFQVYDEEPPSIPDVLAERPVVIVGKWRGQPQGQITLTGIAGDKPYQDTFDVTQVKPLPANAALRYLWARDRIAVLDDYNRLSPEDERVQEVTALGLSYNLLTQYTSFVAIDSEVRLKDGKAVTVKQPLPLPQGVSDLAVGEPQQRAMKNLGYVVGSGNAPAAMEVQAPAPLMASKGKAAYKMAKDEKSVVITANIHLDKVAVSAGLKQAAVEKVFNEKKSQIELCYSTALVKNTGLKGTLVVKLSLDQFGKVTQVTMVSGTLAAPELRKCLTAKLNAWRFPAPSTGKPSTVTLMLNFSP
jgi:Ca-activated chloride channel homolog